MLRLDSFVCIFGAVLLVTLPLNWLLAVLLSAFFHEICHIGALRLLGGKIYGIQIGIGGAVIDAEFSNQISELFCASAGPVGSFLLLHFYHTFPKLAICAGIQGVFNLLPLYPLDGGRILLCFLELCGIRRAATIQKTLEFLLISCFFLLSFGATVFLNLGLLPLLLTSGMILKGISRKRPCKRGENRVQ